MARLNWSKGSTRDRMRERGFESARDDLPPLMVPLSRGDRSPRRRPPSKSALRAEAAALVASYRQRRVTQSPAATSIEIRCENCRHRAIVSVPTPADRQHDQHRPRCSRCGHRQPLPDR